MDLRIKPILISNKIDFKPKLIKNDGEGQYILKGKIHQEDISTLNSCASIPKAPKFNRRNTATA